MTSYEAGISVTNWLIPMTETTQPIGDIDGIGLTVAD